VQLEVTGSYNQRDSEFLSFSIDDIGERWPRRCCTISRRGFFIGAFKRDTRATGEQREMSFSRASSILSLLKAIPIGRPS